MYLVKIYFSIKLEKHNSENATCRQPDLRHTETSRLCRLPVKLIVEAKK
jgi:hypothetical protein